MQEEKSTRAKQERALDSFYVEARRSKPKFGAIWETSELAGAV